MCVRAYMRVCACTGVKSLLSTCHLDHTGHLHMLTLLFLGLHMLAGILESLCGCALENIEVALVARELPRVQVQHVCCHHIQEISGMGHHQEGVGPSTQIVLQPYNKPKFKSKENSNSPVEQLGVLSPSNQDLLEVLLSSTKQVRPASCHVRGCLCEQIPIRLPFADTFGIKAWQFSRRAGKVYAAVAVRLAVQVASLLPTL